jgi:protein-S-isoprenylcysteine O-methyltransferase Ste14
MGIWITILVTWAACAGLGLVRDVSVPWLVTVACWACLDLFWNRAARGSAPAVDGRGATIRSRVLVKIPHLLYCLPLSHVPIFGLRLFPPLSWVEWIGAVMCVFGVAFGIYARRVLAKSWSGDVELTATHTLVQRGPYSLVRHPIYLGLLMALLGMIVALGEVRALVFVYGIDRLLKKLPLEETALRNEYPTAYEEYSRRVPKLIPMWR